jgi:HAD superfamily hydrolase (TIGR01509 family)
MAKERGLILDIDGTLVDSNDAHAAAYVQAFAEMGAATDFTTVRRLIGMGGEKLVPTVRPGWTSASGLGAAVDRRKKEIFARTHLPRLRAFPGARRMVQRARDDGFRVAVASSAESELLAHLLRIADVDDLIEKRTGSSDVDHSKPDPDVVHAALHRLHMPAANAVMVGDTPYDIEAAKRAGVASIAVLCGGWDRDSLRGARAVCEGPADLAARWHEVMATVFAH